MNLHIVGEHSKIGDGITWCWCGVLADILTCKKYLIILNIHIVLTRKQI